MPLGGKSGGTIGNKGGGRKTMEEELKMWKESLKRASIEELAESKVYNHLKKNVNTETGEGIKEIALPVYLKSKADKKELSGRVEIEQITGMEISKDEK